MCYGLAVVLRSGKDDAYGFGMDWSGMAGMVRSCKVWSGPVSFVTVWLVLVRHQGR